jgi:hypothetical protein
MLSAHSLCLRLSLKWKCVRRAYLGCGRAGLLSLEKGNEEDFKQVESPNNHKHRMRAARLPFFPNG